MAPSTCRDCPALSTLIDELPKMTAASETSAELQRQLLTAIQGLDGKVGALSLALAQAGTTGTVRVGAAERIILHVFGPGSGPTVLKMIVPVALGLAGLLMGLSLQEVKSWMGL